MIHSYGQIKAAAWPGMNWNPNAAANTTATTPVPTPPGVRKGRSMSGSLRRKTTKLKLTKMKAMIRLTLPASTSQTSICRPKIGAKIESPPMKIKAFLGVLYFGCSFPNQAGSMPDSAIA